MPENIEIKARLADLAGMEKKVISLGARHAGVLHQHDEFFVSAPGWRLKLRRFRDDAAELIAYARDDRRAPTVSRYHRIAVADPDAMSRALKLALGAAGEVRKTRSLYLLHNTRIHLDHVQDLGDFLELEVMLAPKETAEAGTRTARLLLAKLGISDEDLVESAYVDLLTSAVAMDFDKPSAGC